MIELILTDICHKEVVKPITIEVTYGNSLSVIMVPNPCGLGHVLKDLPVLIAKESINRLIHRTRACRISSLRKIDINEPIVFVIDPSATTSCRFDHQLLTTCPVVIVKVQTNTGCYIPKSKIVGHRPRRRLSRLTRFLVTTAEFGEHARYANPCLLSRNGFLGLVFRRRGGLSFTAAESQQDMAEENDQHSAREIIAYDHCWLGDAFRSAQRNMSPTIHAAVLL